jgi:hypothetical protein
MMFAVLPDLHLAGQIDVTRGHLVVPGPGGDECGRRLVDEWNPWGAADHCSNSGIGCRLRLALVTRSLTSAQPARHAPRHRLCGISHGNARAWEGSPDGEGSPLLCSFRCARWK